MVTSTHKNTAVSQRAKIISISTATTGHALSCFSSGVTNLPGFIGTSENTYVNYPVEKPGQDMGFIIIVDGLSTLSVAQWLGVGVQRRPSTVGGFMDSSGDSTTDAAMDVFWSTGVMVASSVTAQAFIFGPVDTYTYGCNYLGTSSGSVDQYQNFIRMMVGVSTLGGSTGTATFDTLSTNTMDQGGFQICAFQMSE